MPSRRAGFTLVEICVSSVILVVLMGAFTSAITGMVRLAKVGDTQASLRTEANRALKSVQQDLRTSGFVTVGLVDYPSVVNSAFDQFTAQANDSDFGISREIILVQPADVDGDNVPDVDADGALVWSADEISYVHVMAPDGIPVLERRVNGGGGRVVARHVERVVFDDAASSGWNVPLNAVRVQVFFRRPDDDGVVHRYAVESTMRLRNGG